MPSIFPDAEELGLRSIAARRPNVFAAFLKLSQEVMAADAGLSKLDRELIGAYVSKEFGCSFCHLGHRAVAEALGGDEVGALVDQPSPKLAVLYRLADKVAANAVTDAEINAVLAAGYDEKAVEDVIFVAALYGFANRMVTGFGIEFVEARDRPNFKRVARGYV